MRTSLLLLTAILSMAAAHAGPVQRASDTSTVTSDTRIGCNGSTGWIGAAVPCRNYYKFTNVGECHIKLQSLGWDNNAQAWYCSNLGLKN